MHKFYFALKILNVVISFMCVPYQIKYTEKKALQMNKQIEISKCLQNTCINNITISFYFLLSYAAENWIVTCLWKFNHTEIDWQSSSCS